MFSFVEYQTQQQQPQPPLVEQPDPTTTATTTISSEAYWSIALQHAVDAVSAMINEVLQQNPEQPIELEASLRRLSNETGALVKGARASDLEKYTMDEIWTFAQQRCNNTNNSSKSSTTSTIPTATTACKPSSFEPCTDVFYENDIRCSTEKSADGTVKKTWIRKIHLKHLDLVVPERDIGIRVSCKAEIPVAPLDKVATAQPLRIRAKQRSKLSDPDTGMDTCFSMVWQGATIEQSRQTEPMYEIEVEPQQLLHSQRTVASQTGLLAGQLLFQTLNLIGFVQPLSLKLL